MKKLCLISLLALTVAFSANSQNYKPFRVGIHLGYANGGGQGSSGGILFDIEPGYRINDNILINLRLESAAIVRGFSTSISGTTDVAAIGSYTINGQYYFGSGDSFRPFAGVGLGMFSMAAVSTTGIATTTSVAENKIGFYPRLGFDYNHFTISIDYNIIPATSTTVVTSLGTIGTADVTNSYLGVHIGAFFGGGKN